MMKLGRKLLVAPVLTAAVALACGAGYGLVSQHAKLEMRDSDAAETRRVAQVAQTQQQLTQARGDVFRTLALLDSLDDNAVKAQRAQLAQQIATVQKVVAELVAQSAGDAELERLVKPLGPLLSQYLQRCDKAIDLSGMDPNIGVGAMRAAEDTYAQMAKALAGIAARDHTLRAERNASADTQNLYTTLALGGLMLVATLAALAAAWRMQRRIVRDLRRAVVLCEEVAQGKLNTDLRIRGNDEIADLQQALSRMVQGLRASLLTVRHAAENIGTAAGEIAGGNTDLSARTEAAAGSLQKTADSMGQFSGTVQQTAEAARTAQALSASASEVAQRGGDVVAQVVNTMEAINSSSKRIGDIIGTIDGIAFQTNILALNAAVEAARAGDQGRGFAVVATEVRGLAQRSASAAREIKDLIGTSVDRVETGSRQVADAGQTMQEIVASVQRVSTIIGEISRSAGEQSNDIGQVSGAVSDLDRMTQQNAALVEQSAAAAQSLREQTVALSSVVSRFELGTSV
jgi:methyl-accepting chemotaxis protein